MKKHLAIKVTKTKKKENSIIANELIAAFMNRDAELLESLLSYRFNYLNGRSKWETLEYFKAYWELLEEQNIEIQIEECVSMDYYPGCVAYRFRFVEFMGGEDFPSRLILVPIFEHGQLADLAISKRCAPAWVLKRLIINN
jgi:hypothetical protein